ncbi:MAG: hypothetical protein ACPGJS_19640 [Flammeovirgaceae bacterium]
MLAFHGFGQEATAFETLGKSKHVLAFDLPFHSKKSLVYQNQREFIELFSPFFLSDQKSKYDVIACSIGCRLAYALMLNFPTYIRKVHLIAPEGLLIHPLYTFATHTILGQWLFKQSVSSFNILNPMVHFVHQFNLLPKSLIRMAKAQTRSRIHRERVYHTWMIHRDFNVAVTKLAQSIQQHQMQLEFVLGAQDHIITYQHIAPLCNALGDYSYGLKQLNADHFNLLSRYLKTKM